MPARENAEEFADTPVGRVDFFRVFRTRRRPGGGAVAVPAGALATPYVGFVAIGAAYGLLNNAMLVGETRLQDTISGQARATVTSLLGVLEEVVALLVYAAVAAGVAGRLPVPGGAREDSSRDATRS